MFYLINNIGQISLLLELFLFSRLLGDPIYEIVARCAAISVLQRRDRETGLLLKVVDLKTGHCNGKLSCLGAGIYSL